MKNKTIKLTYKTVEILRQKLKEDPKALKYYKTLKEKNDGDLLYGWIFDNDAILTDTLEDLDIYEVNYLNELLNVYIQELTYIIDKANN